MGGCRIISRAFLGWLVAFWTFAAPGNELCPSLMGAMYGDVATVNEGTRQFLEMYRNNDRFHAWVLANEAAQQVPPDLAVEMYRARGGDAMAPDATYRPREVNLTPGSGLFAPHEGVCNACNAAFGPGAFGRTFQPTIYEARVAALRKGDTVVIGKERFTVGNFLGRGNSTHIFELTAIDGRAMSDAVLRLPMMSEPGTALRARDFMRRFVEGRDSVPRGIPRVEVLRADETNFTYAVVTRALGTENGREFRRRLTSSSPTEMQTRATRLETLIRALHPDRDAAWFDASTVPGGTSRRDYLASQFIWESARSPRPDWRLIDWE